MKEKMSSLASDESNYYSMELVKGLCDLRKQNKLCDVTIYVGGRAFHAHKNVLAARSCYFLAMFTSGFKESTQNEISIDGKAEIFEKLLDFAYTGELMVTFETACDILEMACYMLFEGVRKSCCSYVEDACSYSNEMKDHPSMDDVVRIYHQAKYLDLPELVESSERYMFCQLQELKTSEVFFETADEVFLETLLKHEDFSSEDEEKEVLEMVINWLKHDWENRHQYTSLLLGLIRLGHVPEEKLTELLDEEILEVPECKLLLQQTREALQTNCSKRERAQQLPNLFATRSTVTAPIQFSTDNSSDTSHTDVFSYNKSWKRLYNFKTLPYIPSLIVVDEQLYAVGGFKVKGNDWDHWASRTAKLCLNKFVRYDAEPNQWDVLHPMKNKRYNILLVYLDGFLYAIGGSGRDNVYLNCVERYDMKEMYWQRRAPLPEGYRWVSAVPYQGMILAYGVKGSSHVITMYNPDINVWLTKLEEVITHGDYGYIDYSKDPVLFLHNGVCYRVLYRFLTCDSAKNIHFWWPLPIARQAFVNKLEVQTLAAVCKNCPNHPKKTAIIVSIGEEIKQDRIPPSNMSKAGAFHIEDKVFVSFQGYVHQTDVTIQKGYSGYVKLGKWEEFHFGSIGMHSNVTYFTFDKKKVGCYLGS
ncbi:kelch-like protein 38 [Amphiura filiformis]|uniref:kelch-like protein 38 n=1 Tax=Amphiura filiformis TaxID=82378 RepID=UPI003B217386